MDGAGAFDLQYDSKGNCINQKYDDGRHQQFIYKYDDQQNWTEMKVYKVLKKSNDGNVKKVLKQSYTREIEYK